MGFAEELADVLPDDVPERDHLIRVASRHLELIVEVNQQFNLTRILDTREAAIKHVVDSVMPWRLFAEAKHVLDAGTGAGFPGVPLAAVLPSVHFTLAESIGKKARFVEAAIQELGLSNVTVINQRAEEALRTIQADVITARAVAPIERAVELFAGTLTRGSRALLYKGPDTEEEIAAARQALGRRKAQVRVVARYELPDGMGARSVVEMTSNQR